MKEKALYRRLIKQFHPDTTTCPKKKIVYEELTKRINHAFENGNIAELTALDGQGAAAFENAKTIRRSSKGKASPSSHSPPQPPKAAKLGMLARAAREVVLFFLNPYGIVLAMDTWSKNGRCRNLLSLMGGTFWMAGAAFAWRQIDVFARLYGIAHESLAGLGILGLKAVLILASLPTIACLASFGLFTGAILGVCGLLCVIMMKVFGLFHPLLVWVPLAIYMVFAFRFLWHVLANDFSFKDS